MRGYSKDTAEGGEDYRLCFFIVVTDYEYNIREAG